MLEGTDFYKIAPKIIVYKNVFNNDYFMECFEHIKSIDNMWVDWYTFGKQTNFPVKATRPHNVPGVLPYNEFKQDINFDEITDEKLKFFYNYVEDVFYNMTKHYFEITGETPPEGSPISHTTATLLKYIPHESFQPNGSVMGHHTDFQQEKTEEPGYKFFVTCCMYLNHDYDGGQVSFKIFQDESNDPDAEYVKHMYQPEFGDVTIFPSRAPYYHGVKTVTNGIKYFIRSFYMYDYPGSEAWHANKEKYGEELWRQMDRERQIVDLKSGKNTRDEVDEKNGRNG
jgi:hypothetical protein